MTQRQQPTKQMHIVCIFLQHDYKDKIYRLYWAMNLKVLFWMKHPPVKPNVWLASALTEDHAQHAHLQKYGKENSAKSGAKKLAW